MTGRSDLLNELFPVNHPFSLFRRLLDRVAVPGTDKLLGAGRPAIAMSGEPAESGQSAAGGRLIVGCRSYGVWQPR